MATFISTVQFTDQGLQAVKDTCRRSAAFKSSASNMGIEVLHIFWTQGPFDGLVVFAAPDEETATAAMLQLSAAGNVHTQTVRAYDAAEMEQIIGKLSE